VAIVFQQRADVLAYLVQVVLDGVEAHDRRLEHGLVELDGVDTVVLVLNLFFQPAAAVLQLLDVPRVVQVLDVHRQQERKHDRNHPEMLYYKLFELFHISIPLVM